MNLRSLRIGARLGIGFGIILMILVLVLITNTWIGLKNRTIFLHRSKTGHRRQVTISSVLPAKLKAYDLTDEWLFPDWWQGGS